MRRILWILGIAVLIAFIGMQFRQPSFNPGPVNPAAAFEAQMHPTPDVHGVLQKSCYDCHSGQGKVPWYGHVWPASALVQSDIRQARARMDLSNWNNLSLEMSHIRLVAACREMRESKMPLWYYQPLHPGSAPSKEEAESFCAWVYSSPSQPEVAALQ